MAEHPDPRVAVREQLAKDEVKLETQASTYESAIEALRAALGEQATQDQESRRAAVASQVGRIP